MRPKQQFVFLLLLVLTQMSGCGGGRSAVSGGSALNQLGGTINTANFVVPAGTTRTITSDLLVNASFGIEIDGTLNMEPGVSVALISQGTITITGTIQPTPGRVAKALRTSRGTRETRDTPAATYLVISGKDIGVKADSSKLQQGGITTIPGEDIYITTADTFDQVFISSMLETADGEDGTNASLSATGVYTAATGGTKGGTIHIGDSLAIAQVQRIANVTTVAPDSVTISGTIKTGNGGNGGSDLTGGADPKSGWTAQSGNGGSGGGLAVQVTTNINTKSGTIELGHGGDAGDIGAAANPAGPLPRKAAPGKNGVNISVIMGKAGDGGIYFDATKSIQHGAKGQPGNLSIAAGDGGDGVAGSSPLAPGNGGNVTIDPGQNSEFAGGQPGTNTPYPNITITGGTGGASADLSHVGGNGGYLNLKPTSSIFVMVVNQFTLDHFGVGGSGFNGCSASPFLGGPGGDAGTVPGQSPRVSAVTDGWKSLTSPGQIKDLLLTSNGNVSCSGGAGGGGVNKALGGKHGMYGQGFLLGSDGAVGSACAGVGCNGGVLAASYTLIPLPNITTPNAINVHGHVVGSDGNTLSAVFWDGVMLTTIGPGTALALNNSDMVVGFDNLIGQSGSSSNAWYWTLAKGKQYLPSLPGATESAAIGINTDGAIVGTAFVPGVGGSVIYWSSPTAVPVPLAKLPDGSLPNPIAISDSGVIAGSDAFWPSPTSAPVLLNSLAKNLAQSYVQVNAVDSVGNLYGVATSASVFRHSMEWKAGSTTPTDLTPGDTTNTTQALAVNSVGTVVGIPGAFSAGKAVQLGPRITNLGNLVILKATGINACGQILVIAADSPSPLASSTGYLLSPQ